MHAGRLINSHCTSQHCPGLTSTEVAIECGFHQSVGDRLAKHFSRQCQELLRMVHKGRDATQPEHEPCSEECRGWLTMICGFVVCEVKL
jgi:hypothetical protein